MLRALGAFLAMFWLLSLVVHLDELAHLFGGAALVLLAIDLLLASYARGMSTSRARMRPVL